VTARLAGLASLRRVLAALGPRAPARVAAWADAIEAAPEPRDAALLAAAAELEPALAYLVRDEENAALGALLPQYPPGLPPGVRARLALGETPSAVSSGLTRSEAHAWLLAGAPPVVRWYIDRVTGGRCSVEPRELAVARWLVAALADPPRAEALERPRRELLAGRAVEGRYLERVDELRAVDLRPSVEETYRRAAARLMASLERALRSRGEPLHGVPSWWRPVRCARLLRSGADLVREGRGLEHCLATYAANVRSGDSVIVGICVCGLRSTVEIDPRAMRVRQHRGPGNGAPPEICARALAVCCARWGVAAC